MSDDLARARARKAAGEWLARRWQTETGFTREALIDAFEAGYQEQIDHGVLSGDEVAMTVAALDQAAQGGPFTPSDFKRAASAVLSLRDRIVGLTTDRQRDQDEWTVERAQGQRQLDTATALMTEARDLFRGYEAHHQDKIDRFRGRPDVPEDVKTFNILRGRVETNALMAARLDAWLKGEDRYPVSVGERPDDAPVGIKVGGFMEEGPRHDIPVAMVLGTNTADVARQIAERMVDGETIKGVDHESFDRAAAYLDQPVPVPHIMAPVTPDPVITTVGDERLAECRHRGFVYWPGGEGPPADWDGGEVLLDWMVSTRHEGRFTICPAEKLSPHPGLWRADNDPESYATIIGYRAAIPVGTDDRTVEDCRQRFPGTSEVSFVPPPSAKVIEHPLPIHQPRVRIEGVTEYETPADAATDGKKPRDLIAAEPDPRAALVHARNWLISAEQLIAEASDFIRGVTGANPGSDSEDICQRLDAWLTPMATRPADEGAEKEARRSSSTHQGD